MAIRRNQAPNVTERLNSYVMRFPDAWAVAHRHGHPRAGEWIQKAVAALRAEHPGGARWVCNGKRGNPNDLSWDVVGYVVDEAGGNPRMIECYDVIGDAGGANPRITWNNITNYDAMGGDGTAIAVIPPPLTGGVEPPPDVVEGVWTQRHQDVADALSQLFFTDPIQAYAEQFAHSFAAEQWGRKRSGPGRPLSNDTIARRLPNGRLYGVRVIPTVHLWGILDAAQEFEPVVPGDYLTAPEPPPVEPGPETPAPETPEPETPEPSVDLVDEVVSRVLDGLAPSLDALHDSVNDLYAKLDALDAELQNTQQKLDAFQRTLDTLRPPVYEGRIFGQRITFTPTKG